MASTNPASRTRAVFNSSVVKPSHIFEERGIAKSNFYDQSFWMDGTRTETLSWILEQKRLHFIQNLTKI